MMKRFIAILLSLVCFTSFAQQKDTLYVLGVGNSWTRDSMRWLSAIARSAGRPVVVGHAYLGGSSLKDQFYGIDDENYSYDHNSKQQIVHSTYQYWKYVGTDDPVKTPAEGYGNGLNGIGVTLESVVRDEPWDVMVLQPSQSAYAGEGYRDHFTQTDKSFNINALVERLKAMMDPEVAAKVRVGLMVPFSYPKGCTRYGQWMAEEIFPGSDITTQEEWDEVYERYHDHIQAMTPEIVTFMGESSPFVVNVGLAIHKARRDSLLSKSGYCLQRSVDNTHLSEGIAMYVASLCYAYTILGIKKNEAVFYPKHSKDPKITGDTGKTDFIVVANTPAMARHARRIAYSVSKGCD